MGVKLQLLLGLLLIGSICGSDKISHSQNASLEKVDSTTNLLEKLPKTDTQINLVKKDTQDIPDSSKYSEYSQENDTHENKTSSHEDLDNIEKSGHARKGNSRSIDIEKFDSHDFQNNDFGLSDDQKVQENSVRKASTKGYINLSNFQLTTSESSFDTQNQLSTPTSFFDATHNLDHPKSQLTTPENFFDGKVDEDNQKLETSYDGQEHLDHHPFHDDDDDIENDENENHEQDHDNHFQKLFGESKSAPNSTLTYKEKTKISKNNTVGDNSEYNELRVEKSHNINYASTYDFTSSDGDVTEKVEEMETTSPRGFTDTTKRTTTVTKSSTSQSSHILSNKIETETIKAINSLTTEYSTTKRLKEENNLIPKEQTVEENKIIPLEAIVPMTTKHIVKNKNDTTEQTKEINSNPTDQNINYDNTTQKSIEQITVTNSYTEITTTERVNNINMKEFETTTVLPLTNEQTTIIEDNSQKTTEDNITYIPTTQYIIEATTMNEVQKETNGQEDTTEQSTPQQITTETINRISKAFSFGSTHTLNSETTELYTETMEIKLSSPTSEADNTTPSMTIIVTGTETEATNPITNTENETTVATETNNETTTVATKTEEETTTSHTAYTGSETTTKIMHIPKIIQTTTLTPMTTGEMETSTDRSKLDTTTLNYPFPTNITVIPVSMNVTDETTVHSTTDDFPESSSAGADAGNLGSGEENKGKIAAIIISTVGAVCLILLAGLLYIMRKRQRRFNYKQRCRPVGLDDYSVDNVSGYNSTRRKAERQSKRSYGNPAFDDPVAVTHPLNFPALAKFATNLEEVKAEFGEIPQITAKTYELPEGCEIKNRYANVIPLPETRVFLQPIDGYPNSDYINANYVTGPKNTKGYYIACQAPISNTVDDFWRMIWEQQTKVILMLTHLFENGIEKCVDYLPPSEVLDCNRLFGDFQVTLKKRDVKEKYIISNLQLKNMVSNSWREITHFWYLGWPDKGVPSEENSIIAFLIEARSYMKSATLDKNAAMNGNMNGSSKNEINPVVVHCSPGTGRTGVVLACDIAIREFEQSRLVDIPKIVYRIRRDRASAVQTKEQYLFIYKVVNLYATKLTGGALESL